MNVTRNIFRWEIFLQTKFRLLVTKYFITESQFSCSDRDKIVMNDPNDVIAYQNQLRDYECIFF